MLCLHSKCGAIAYRARKGVQQQNLVLNCCRQHPGRLRSTACSANLRPRAGRACSPSGGVLQICTCFVAGRVGSGIDELAHEVWLELREAHGREPRVVAVGVEREAVRGAVGPHGLLRPGLILLLLLLLRRAGPHVQGASAARHPKPLRARASSLRKVSLTSLVSLSAPLTQALPSSCQRIYSRRENLAGMKLVSSCLPRAQG